jgi:hypothetical protein
VLLFRLCCCLVDFVVSEWAPSPLDPFEVLPCVVACAAPSASDHAALLAYAAHHYGPSSSRKGSSSSSSSTSGEREEPAARKRDQGEDQGDSGGKRERSF